MLFEKLQCRRNALCRTGKAGAPYPPGLYVFGLTLGSQPSVTDFKGAALAETSLNLLGLVTTQGFDHLIVGVGESGCQSTAAW